VVPDNFEFFLRPRTQPATWHVRNLLKAATYGLTLDSALGRVGQFGERIIYELYEGCAINEELSFYNVEEERDLPARPANAVFISQPYYLDYSIAIGDWLDALKNCFSFIEERGYRITVRYHQRDSQQLKDTVREWGIQEHADADCQTVFGLFSTLLFELALSGRSVYSCFDSFTHLFPKYYSDYVRTSATSLQIATEGSAPWTVSATAFRELAGAMTGQPRRSNDNPSSLSG
jgi:hypothetical protein